MSIHVLSPGTHTTVQDYGRSGFQKYGVQENGVCDKYSYRIANLIAGNRQSRHLPVLEMTYMGGTFEFETQQIICLTGADMKAELNGSPVPRYEPIPVASGDILKMSAAVQGLRSYIAVHGGIDVPSVMKSASTSLKCGMGGYKGRALQKGDVLFCAASDSDVKEYTAYLNNRNSQRLQRAEERWTLKSSGERIVNQEVYPLIRVVKGPQEEAFTLKGLDIFGQTIYRISEQSDRMAYRMEGEIIETVKGSDIISDGIVEGSVQVSSDGQPIIMMADHQTTGGYAKIATVISADIPRLAQMKPGEQLGFEFITAQQAVQAARDMDNILKEMEQFWMEANDGYEASST